MLWVRDRWAVQVKGPHWGLEQGKAKSLQAWLKPAQRILQPVSEWTVYGFEAVMDPAMVAHHASFVANQTRWRATLDQTTAAKGPSFKASKAGRQLEHAFEARTAAQEAAKQELKAGRERRQPTPQQQKPERFSMAKAWQEDVSRIAAAPDAVEELAAESQVTQWHGKRNWEFQAPWHKQRQAHLQQLAQQS